MEDLLELSQFSALDEQTDSDFEDDVGLDKIISKGSAYCRAPVA